MVVFSLYFTQIVILRS